MIGTINQYIDRNEKVSFEKNCYFAIIIDNIVSYNDRLRACLIGLPIHIFAYRISSKHKFYIHIYINHITILCIFALCKAYVEKEDRGE